MKKQYVKKPVVITAVKITEESFDEQPHEDHFEGPIYNPLSKTVEIETLKGKMIGNVGDWIIQGIRGECYPCKSDIFEASYKELTQQNMSFGEAIEAMKNGQFVRRAGWNGKGMYLWLMKPVTIPVDWCKEPHLKKLAEENGGSFDALGTIRMKTADNKVLTGWLASQTDMLSEDWEICNP